LIAISIETENKKWVKLPTINCFLLYLEEITHQGSFAILQKIEKLLLRLSIGKTSTFQKQRVDMLSSTLFRKAKCSEVMFK